MDKPTFPFHPCITTLSHQSKLYQTRIIFEGWRHCLWWVTRNCSQCELCLLDNCTTTKSTMSNYNQFFCILYLDKSRAQKHSTIQEAPTPFFFLFDLKKSFKVVTLCPFYVCFFLPLSPAAKLNCSAQPIFIILPLVGDQVLHVGSILGRLVGVESVAFPRKQLASTSGP